MNEKGGWYFLALSEDEIEFSEGGIAEVTLAGKKICISKSNETLFAFSATCPHAGGSLAGGYTDQSGNIVCPLHRYKFNMATGRNTTGEGYYLKTFPVHKTPDGIYIQIKKTGLFS